MGSPDRLDPRTKLVLGAMGVGAILSTQGMTLLVLEWSLLFGGLLALKTVKAWARTLRLILPLIGMVFVVSSISFTLDVALALSLRLLNLLTVSFIFFQGVKVEELGGSLRKMGIPYEFCFILTASLRYVPLIGRRARSIMDAQRSRGIDLRPRIRNVPHYIALLLPLLVQTFVLAEQLAMAMESRGFGKGERSFRREYRISYWEYAMMTTGLIILAVFVAWDRGWIR